MKFLESAKRPKSWKWCNVKVKQICYKWRSFNCVTNGPPYRVAVRSKGKLRWFHRAVIFSNRMKFRSNPFSLSKVIESSSWFSHIHSKVKAHYEKLRSATGLRGLCLIHDNAPAHKCDLVQDFLKEDTVVHLSHPPYSPNLSQCDFFLFLLLKKTLSDRRYESRSALSSTIYQCLQGKPKKAYFSAFIEWISRLDKRVSLKEEYFEELK